MRTALGIALLAALTASTSAGAEATARASLKLTDRAPLTVRGAHFRRYERVTVTARVGVVRRVVVRASATGAFVARFQGVRLDRCDTVVVSAVGATGSRATLKTAAPLLCPPPLSP